MDQTSNSKVSMIDVVKHLWRAVRPQKFSLLYTLFAFSVSSVVTVVVPFIYKNFFDLLTSTKSKSIVVPELIRIIFLILALHSVSWILFRTGMKVLNKMESRTMARIRQMSFDYMIRHSYSFFSNNFTGSLVQKVGRFARSFERLYDMIVFNVIPLIIHTTGAIIIVYSEQQIIAYIIAAWIAVIFVFNFFFQRWKLKYDLLATKADSATSAALSDSVSNQNTIMSFAGFDIESSNFKKVTLDQSDKQIKAWDLSVMKDAFQQGLTVIIEFVIFYYAIKMWEINMITIGTFVLIQVYILSLAQRLWDFGRIIRSLYEIFADSKEMVEILETPYDVKDTPNATEILVKSGEIKFKNVTFAFNETRNVLENINLDIKQGQKVALIGPSGAGKSTLVKLLLRMYELTSGSIEVDDQDIKNVTQDSLRKNISLVPQDPILFHRTLKENIRYGREDATDEEVITASKLAHCDEFIDVLPLKYDTYVGERGIKLSGGERQRVAIARAILKNARILVLDEATSSLDSHSESLIQDALDKLMEDKTVIVIAHRLSTIRKMDRVIVINNGQIEEDGNHEELLNKKKSLYKDLWNLQAGGFLPI